MIRISGNTSLCLVQGDTFNLRLKVRYGYDVIKSVVFSCPELNISKPFELTTIEGADGKEKRYYLLTIPASDSEKLPPCITDYSVTVTFQDGTVRTAAYRQQFTVLKKGELQ